MWVSEWILDSLLPRGSGDLFFCSQPVLIYSVDLNPNALIPKMDRLIEG